MATLKTKLLLRNDTTGNWTDCHETVLSKGEAGVEWYIDATTKQTMTKLKIGDGTSTWAQLPYIQQGMIAASVTTDNGGNTVVSAQVDYSNGVYTIKLLKKNRVVDIEVSDDNVVDLSVTPNWNEVGGTNKGHKITASHKTYHTGTVPSTTVTAAGDKTPAADYTINVPKVTIDKYGHTTKIENQAVVVKAHDVKVTNDDNTTGNTIISISKGDNHEVKYTKGNRVIPSNTLTADQIIVGNGTYNAKASGKTIVTSITNSDNVPTDKAVKTYVDAKVASAVQYLGTISAVAKLSTTAGKGDFYRASADITDVWHAGDIIIAEKDNPTAKVDGTNWSVIHGEEVGVESISAADKSIIIGGTAAQPTIKVNTGYTNNGKNYKVEVSDTGLFVNVPWTDTKNSYTASAGIKIVDNDIQHTNSVTAGTASGTDSTTAQALGTTITIPKVTYDAQGHIKSTGTTSFVLPNASEVQKGVFTFGQVKAGSNTAEADKYNDTLTVSGDTWIIPAVDASTDTLSFAHKAGTDFEGKTAAKPLTWSDTSFIVPQITTDVGGHVISASNITFNIPNAVVSNTTDGLAPKIAKANSFLMSKNGTSSVWDSVTILDGGSANTSDWGRIS